MVPRTILVPLSGGAASQGAAETACRLAGRFAAHIEALHIRPGPNESAPLVGQDIAAPVVAELIAMAEQDIAQHAARAKAVFEAALARHGLARQDEPSPGGNAG